MHTQIAIGMSEYTRALYSFWRRKNPTTFNRKTIVATEIFVLNSNDFYVCFLCAFAWKHPMNSPFRSFAGKQTPYSTHIAQYIWNLLLVFSSLLISFKVTFDNFPDCWAYNNISYIECVCRRIVPFNVKCTFRCNSNNNDQIEANEITLIIITKQASTIEMKHTHIQKKIW